MPALYRPLYQQIEMFYHGFPITLTHKFSYKNH